MAQAWGVDDQVVEVSHRIGYLESLKSLLDADALLLLGSSDRAYSPSKLYPCFLSNRPMLSVVLRDSCVADLLTELSCSAVAAFSPDAAGDAAQAEIHRFFDLALAGFSSATPSPRNETCFSAPISPKPWPSANANCSNGSSPLINPMGSSGQIPSPEASQRLYRLGLASLIVGCGWLYLQSPLKDPLLIGSGLGIVILATWPMLEWGVISGRGFPCLRSSCDHDELLCAAAPGRASGGPGVL